MAKEQKEEKNVIYDSEEEKKKRFLSTALAAATLRNRHVIDDIVTTKFSVSVIGHLVRLAIVIILATILRPKLDKDGVSVVQNATGKNPLAGVDNWVAKWTGKTSSTVEVA